MKDKFSGKYFCSLDEANIKNVIYEDHRTLPNK